MNNVVDLGITEIDNINSLIKKLENKILCELIIDMKTISGERIFLAVKKLWQGEYML